MRKLLAGTQVVIGIVGIRPIDVEIVVVPVAVRHIAIEVAGARSLLPDFVHFTDNFFQNYLR